MQFRVDRVPASVTWELRQAVLRPHQAIDQLALPDDDETSTGTFAAIDENEEVVGTVRVAPASPPVSPRCRSTGQRFNLATAGNGHS